MVGMAEVGAPISLDGWKSIHTVGASACVMFILLQKIQKIAKCTFWYQLTQVFSDRVHRTVKWLCVVCVCYMSTKCIVLYVGTTTRPPDWPHNIHQWAFTGRELPGVAVWFWCWKLQRQHIRVARVQCWSQSSLHTAGKFLLTCLAACLHCVTVRFCFTPLDAMLAQD